jgi:hypothetical protein
MPEPEKSHVSDPVKVTDADLGAALDGMAPKEVEVKVEELKDVEKEVKQEIKEVKAELRDKDGLTHDERSQMGRRLKKLEETQDVVLSTLNELKELAQYRVSREARADNGNTKGLPEFISTPQDVLAIEDWIEGKDAEYQQDYMKVIQNLSKKNPDEHEAVFEEMFQNFNVKRGKKKDPNTWNPIIDAQLNYAEARAAYYSKRAAQPHAKATVKNKPVELPINLTVETESESIGAGEPVVLDDISKGFLTSIGKDSNWARKAMG